MKKGFTLVEMLVVVAIVGLIASVVLAMFNTSHTKSKIGHYTDISKISASTGGAVIDYNSDDYCSESMSESDNGCGCVKNADAKKDCETAAENTKAVQDCIDRYIN